MPYRQIFYFYYSVIISSPERLWHLYQKHTSRYKLFHKYFYLFVTFYAEMMLLWCFSWLVLSLFVNHLEYLMTTLALFSSLSLVMANMRKEWMRGWVRSSAKRDRVRLTETLLILQASTIKEWTRSWVPPTRWPRMAACCPTGQRTTYWNLVYSAGYHEKGMDEKLTTANPLAPNGGLLPTGQGTTYWNLVYSAG